MSAAVVPFTRKNANPAFLRSDYCVRADNRAVRDARLIREARESGEAWLEAAFIALLKTLDSQQQRAVEGLLTIRAVAGDDHSAEQAAAIIRARVTGSPEHCGRVAEIMTRMEGGAR